MSEIEKTAIDIRESRAVKTRCSYVYNYVKRNHIYYQTRTRDSLSPMCKYRSLPNG